MNLSWCQSFTGLLLLLLLSWPRQSLPQQEVNPHHPSANALLKMSVYHWASVTPGKSWGRVVGFFAGYWNWLAWVFGAASMSFIFGETSPGWYTFLSDRPD